MKTKEEILKSRFSEYWSQEVDKKTHPFIIDILDCMEEYANQQLQLGGVIVSKNECRIGWDCIRFGKRSDDECNGCGWWYPLNS